MKQQFNRLLEPIKIGEVEIKNRIAMAPMAVFGLVNSDGNLGKRGIEYYVERARGGVGLIITGLFKVENEIEATVPGVPLISRASVAPFGELAESVHALGSKIFVQLTGGYGRVGHPTMLLKRPVAPSALPNYWDPAVTCRELETEEVEQLVRHFGEAAEILAMADVDGVEIHAVHEGYLLDQFTLSMFNRRGDKYGGDLEGRLRFPIEVVREIKEKAGRDFPVQLRFSVKSFIRDWGQGGLPGEEFEEKGRDVQEGLHIAQMLEEAGYDAFNADGGSYEAWYWAHPPVYQEHGLYLPLTEQLRKSVNVPVLAAGRMEIPELAEMAIAEGKADMVALGRGLLTDPSWVRKVEQGKRERIRPCIGCHNGCLDRVARSKPLSCAVNPAVGREGAYGLRRADEPKNIMVVGGGITSLEASRVAALRGHRVCLYEKSKALGGHLIEASVPSFKKDLQRLVEWYKIELEYLKENVDITLGIEVTVDLVQREKPDVTIIATGSSSIVPDIPGINGDNVATDIDVLLGNKGAGKKVIVVGGGMIGCEVALWLAQQGKKVTVVEVLAELMTATWVPHANRIMLLDLLKLNGVEVLTNHCLQEVTQTSAVFMSRTFETRKFKADTFVISVGLRPNRALYHALVGKIPNLYLIGDARKGHTIMNGIWDAYEVARAIG
jgi:2-enoate reductase